MQGNPVATDSCDDCLLRVIMSQELDEEANEHTRQHVHHHTCSNLFGCGDEKGIGILREDIKERAFDNRASDRLLHMDEINQANLVLVPTDSPRD